MFRSLKKRRKMDFNLYLIEQEEWDATTQSHGDALEGVKDEKKHDTWQVGSPTVSRARVIIVEADAAAFNVDTTLFRFSSSASKICLPPCHVNDTSLRRSHKRSRWRTYAASQRLLMAETRTSYSTARSCSTSDCTMTRFDYGLDLTVRDRFDGFRCIPRCWLASLLDKNPILEYPHRLFVRDR